MHHVHCAPFEELVHTFSLIVLRQRLAPIGRGKIGKPVSLHRICSEVTQNLKEKAAWRGSRYVQHPCHQITYPHLYHIRYASTPGTAAGRNLNCTGTRRRAQAPVEQVKGDPGFVEHHADFGLMSQFSPLQRRHPKVSAIVVKPKPFQDFSRTWYPVLTSMLELWPLPSPCSGSTLIHSSGFSLASLQKAASA